MLKFLLFVLAGVCIAAFPPAAIALAIVFVLAVLWDEWKRDKLG